MIKKPGFEQPLIFTCVTSDADAASAQISASLGAEVAAKFGPPDASPLSIHAYADAATLIGGVNGAMHWRWLYVRHFWVMEGWRGRGVGRRLLVDAEAQSRARGCVGVYLDTFDPAAAGFYEGCGFNRVGEIEDFPPGHQRIFLSKALI